MKLAFACGYTPLMASTQARAIFLACEPTVGEAAMAEQEEATQDTFRSEPTAQSRSTKAVGAHRMDPRTSTPIPHESQSMYNTGQTGHVMTAASILFSEAVPATAEDAQMPEGFPDLNLDQIIDGILDGHEAYCLRQYYYLPLESVGAIQYRQACAIQPSQRRIFRS